MPSDVNVKDWLANTSLRLLHDALSCHPRTLPCHFPSAITLWRWHSAAGNKKDSAELQAEVDNVRNRMVFLARALPVPVTVQDTLLLGARETLLEYLETFIERLCSEYLHDERIHAHKQHQQEQDHTVEHRSLSELREPFADEREHKRNTPFMSSVATFFMKQPTLLGGHECLVCVSELEQSFFPSKHSTWNERKMAQVEFFEFEEAKQPNSNTHVHFKN